MLFREYEEIILRHMWGNGIEPTGSGKLWEMANVELKKSSMKKTISRASIIFAANRFVDAGIWGWDDATGKGGHHRLYFPKMNEEELWLAVKETANRKIDSVIETYRVMHGVE